MANALVVVSLPGTTSGSHELLREVLRRSRARGIDVEVSSDLFAAPEFNFELDEFSGFFRFHATPQRSRRAQQWLKSLLDRILRAVGSLAAALLTPPVALLLKLEDGGPVFYSREFVGDDGRVHYYLKFRTMQRNADEILKDDAQLKAKFDEKCKLLDDPVVGYFNLEPPPQAFPQRSTDGR